VAANDRTEGRPSAKYTPNVSAIRTLTRTFWTAKGWRSATKDVSSLPSLEETRGAVDQGIMFDGPEWRLSHDELVAEVSAAVSNVALETVSEAFISSLATGRLDLRSALGSYAVGRYLPDHQLQPGPSYRCRLCGLPTGERSLDRNVLNFERFKWGGVRTDDLAYVAFDLRQFSCAPLVPLTADAIQLGRDLLSYLDSLPARATATDAAVGMKLLKGNQAERMGIMDILGVCGILETRNHQGYGDEFVPFVARDIPAKRFVERTYPVCWWTAADGINRSNLRAFLPQLI
jgi:hypothetical protein